MYRRVLACNLAASLVTTRLGLYYPEYGLARLLLMELPLSLSLCKVNPLTSKGLRLRDELDAAYFLHAEPKGYLYPGYVNSDLTCVLVIVM